MTTYSYTCSKCQHHFVNENRYLNHQCKQMKRENLFKEPLGQSAWIFYQKWMKSYNRITPNAQAFINSKYFSSFFKFAEFAKRLKLVDIDAYVTLMRKHDLAPSMWTTDIVYGKYLEHLDNVMPAEKLAQITINTLFDYADRHAIDISDVFTIMTPNEVIQLLRERRISPWILLISKKFSHFVKNKMTLDQQTLLESIIPPNTWTKKFTSNPELVKKMKSYVGELKL